ncbi:MAG TPA: alpha/beta fold hydrolase [Candidatus Eisenbacteria bacterium]|jgi:pimeloyl-ACP methyl ester carboxylesterase|nr:alpha/beta fold hydrolase [Candidatus Eisenbacteria bacterium]
MPKVSFLTEDGVTIVGDHRPGPKDAPAALLLHMMPATKESWDPLQVALAGRGFATLAIDLRGHGESVVGAAGAKLDHKQFTDAEHQASMFDVDAAVRWFAAQGVPASRLAIVGASIGANLAIVYAAAHPEVPAAVALSPGIAYHGVRTEDAAKAFPRGQKLLLAASDDDEYSFSSIDALAKADENAELQKLSGAGHGTTMFERRPDFLAYVSEWIVRNTVPS